MGWNSQPTRSVILEDCKVPVSNLLGQEGSGFKIAMKGLDGGRVNIAACSVGGAQKCLEVSRDYVKDRIQFGVPLAEHQSIQFKLADMATALYGSRLMVRHAAQLLDAQDPAASPCAAMAKLRACDDSFWVSLVFPLTKDC